MTTTQASVLVVDDEPANIDLLKGILGETYKIFAATSGEKALKLAQSKPEIDLVLLDVMMPGLDGYDTCRELKADPDTKHIPVIFVSALDELDEIMCGYEAGGNDYLIKPIKSAELLQKVNIAIEDQKARLLVESEKASAMDTAMTAISSMGEQGLILDFLRRSFLANDIEALGRLIVESTTNFGLENSVQIRSTRDVINASSDEPISPLEHELLMRFKDAGRLREKGETCVVNFGSITQLIKNMPDDDDKRGRLRDHLALLVEGAQARLEALEMQAELNSVVASSNEALLQIQSLSEESREAGMRIMDDMTEEMEEILLSYGLSEEQENALLEVLKKGVNTSLDNLDRGVSADNQLRKIVEGLQRFVKVD